MKETFFKEYWSRSQLSIVKILVTAVAAITMTYISQKLSIISGAYLAGLIAVISLLLNEIYNFVFQWITNKASHTIAKLEKNTEESKSYTPEKTIENSSKGKNQETPQKDEKVSTSKKLGNFLNNHPNLRLTIFFILVSIMVIGVNHFSPKVNQTIHPTMKVEVDEATKQAIVDEAIEEALEKTPPTIINNEQGDTQKLETDLNTTKELFSLNTETLKNSYELLKQENELLLEEHNQLLIETQKQQEEIQALQKELVNLSQQMNDIEVEIREMKEERNMETSSENL